MVGSISSQIIRLAVLIDSHDPNAVSALPPPNTTAPTLPPKPVFFLPVSSQPKNAVIYGKKS